MRPQYERAGRAVYRDRRWPPLRLAAKRRDGWQCVQCARRQRLEVDHVQSVRDRPDLAFDLNNLQTLCGSCHSRKTRVEIGLAPPNPELEKWRDLLRST